MFRDLGFGREGRDNANGEVVLATSCYKHTHAFYLVGPCSFMEVDNPSAIIYTRRCTWRCKSYGCFRSLRGVDSCFDSEARMEREGGTSGVVAVNIDIDHPINTRILF
jgi:hypothetical protein